MSSGDSKRNFCLRVSTERDGKATKVDSFDFVIAYNLSTIKPKPKRNSGMLTREYSMLTIVSLFFRIFEGDPSEITTLREAEYREHVLRQTLKQVQLRKVSLFA